MDKEALLKIILSDLGEIETMIKSFRGQGEIPMAFLELTEKKMSHLVAEFSLLKRLNDSKPLESNAQQRPIYTAQETSSQATPTEAPIIQPLAHTPAAPAVEPLPRSVEVQQASVENKLEEEIEEEPKATEVKPMEVVKTTILEVPKVAPVEVAKSNEKTRPVSEAKSDTSIRTLGDSFGGDKKSVNEFISQQPSDKKFFKGKPVNDLTKGLGINDRFLFQRELFSGKSDLMNQTLQQINQMPDLQSAQSFIQANFDWNHEQEVAKAFLSYIERKF